MKHLTGFALATALAIQASAAGATNLGSIGPTYGIAEPHLLQHIQQQLVDKQRSGELQRLMQEAQSRGIQAVKQPATVPGLQATATARTFYVDPSFRLDRNIVDAQGRLMFAAGMRKNPLDVVTMSRQLLFFDARDPRQVARARALIGTQGHKLKPILTGGSYLDLMKVWRVPVYYDQHGALTRRLGIKQVPALVSQEGLRLRVDKVALP